MENALDKLAERMINGARADITKFLLETPFDKQGMGKSGYLTEEDIKDIERITNKKVYTSVESGEYFYCLRHKQS